MGTSSFATASLVGAVLAVAVPVTVLAVQRHHSLAQPGVSGSELDPDLAVVHYRYTIAAAPDSDLAATIGALEGRIKDSIASPFDLADLADAYFHRAAATGDVEDYARSEAAARRSLELFPYPNGVVVVLAKLANARHEFRDAIQLANSYLAHKQSAGADIVLASAYLAVGELDHSIEAAEAAVALKPDTSSYLMRALVLQAEGRDAEAAFDFTRAAALEVPGDLQEAARTRALWGRFLLRRGELAGAGAVFSEALRIVPGHPLALAYQAELALRTGKLKEARAMFEQAFATSHQVRYLIDLARAQELAGDPRGADSTRGQVEQLVRADLAEHGVGHKLDLVEVLVDRGKPADLVEAVTLGREELVHRPSADTRFQLARALHRSGLRTEAALQIRAVLATGARDARYYELAARLEDGPRKALYLREAQQLDPGSSGWRGLGLGVAR